MTLSRGVVSVEVALIDILDSSILFFLSLPMLRLRHSRHKCRQLICTLIRSYAVVFCFFEGDDDNESSVCGFERSFLSLANFTMSV